MPSQFDLLGNQWNAANLDQGAQELAAANELIRSVGGLGPPIQQLGNYGPQGLPPQQGPVENLRGFGANLAAHLKATATPPTLTNMSITTDPETGERTISAKDIPEDTLRYYEQASQFYQQALGGYALEAQRLQMERERVESQPWLQLATALSANLASAKDMPGWVQGLGRTAAQLNPTADELRARQLAVLGKGAEMSEKGMALGIAQERTMEDRIARKEALVEKQQKEALALENQREDDYGKFLKDEAARAEKLRMFDESSIQRIVAQGKQLGRSDERIAHAVDAVRAAAEGGVAAYKEKQDEWDRQEKIRKADRRELIGMLQGQIDARAKEGREQRLVDQEIGRYGQETMPPDKAQEAFRASLKVLQIKGDMEERLKKVSTGPLAGRAQVANPWRPGEWQGIISLANNLYIAGIGGNLGRATERDMDIIRKMNPGAPHMTREQSDAAMAVMESLNIENVTNLMATYPHRGFWSSLRPLFAQLDKKESQRGQAPSKKYEKIFDEAYKDVARTTEERFPLLFNPGERPKAAERRLGSTVDYQSEAAKLKPGQQMMLPDGTVIGRDPAGNVLITKGR